MDVWFIGNKKSRDLFLKMRLFDKQKSRGF